MTTLIATCGCSQPCRGVTRQGWPDCKRSVLPAGQHWLSCYEQPANQAGKSRPTRPGRAGQPGREEPANQAGKKRRGPP